MADRPSGLGLLPAIAAHGARAERHLALGRATTSEPEAAAVVRKVAGRDGEHGASVGRRVDGLGFEVRKPPDPASGERLEVAGSQLGDLETMRSVGRLAAATAGSPATSSAATS